MKRYAIIGLALLGGGLFFGRGMSGELRPLVPEYPSGARPQIQQMETNEKVDRSVYVQFQEKIKGWPDEQRQKLRHSFHARLKEAIEERNWAPVEHYAKLLALLDGEVLDK